MNRNEILKKDDFRCHYCKHPLTNRTMHIDHVLPRSKGGTDEPDNLVACCPACNSQKGSKTIEEWKAKGISLPDPEEGLFELLKEEGWMVEEDSDIIKIPPSADYEECEEDEEDEEIENDSFMADIIDRAEYIAEMRKSGEQRRREREEFYKWGMRYEITPDKPA